MGLEARFSRSDLSRMFESRIRGVEMAIIEQLRTLGYQCVTIAKDKNESNGGYGDITGNLRASVGFIIVKDGVIVDRNFDSGRLDNEGKGKETGESYAEKVASRFPKGYVLIVVAGMDYAAAVESRNRDVLTSAEIHATGKIGQILRELKAGIK